MEYLQKANSMGSLPSTCSIPAAKSLSSTASIPQSLHLHEQSQSGRKTFVSLVQGKGGVYNLHFSSVVCTEFKVANLN